jgi:RNA polymerase sigma-70 factor (ECF subfamily)
VQPLIEETEAGLVEQARRGNRNAFGELARRHYPGVVRVVYRLCGDQQMAEDASQDAFLRAWLHLASFRPNSSLRNWLYRIAVNAALDGLRRRPEETIDEELLMASEPTPGTLTGPALNDPEAALIQKEQADLLQQALKSLPEASRSVLTLREYGELSYAEIAAVLDIPVGTVMSRLNYARNRLRTVLTGYSVEMEREHV